MRWFNTRNVVRNRDLICIFRPIFSPIIAVIRLHTIVPTPTLFPSAPSVLRFEFSSFSSLHWSHSLEESPLTGQRSERFRGIFEILQFFLFAFEHFLKLSYRNSPIMWSFHAATNIFAGSVQRRSRYGREDGTIRVTVVQLKNTIDHVQCEKGISTDMLGNNTVEGGDYCSLVDIDFSDGRLLPHLPLCSQRRPSNLQGAAG